VYKSGDRLGNRSGDEGGAIVIRWKNGVQTLHLMGVVLLQSGLKTVDHLDRTDFGLDRTAQAVCGPKTEKVWTRPWTEPDRDWPALFPK